LVGDVAGELADPGRDSPKVSIMVAKVLAVYMPPQAPAPGHAFFSISVMISSAVSEGSSDHDFKELNKYAP
jgi:hypothetical protein